MVFLWHSLHRQVRIEGEVSVISAEQSTKYFQSRPKGSQIGAWASPQSKAIADRSILEKKVEELEALYQDTDVLPKPDFWGGYILKPSAIEFWQGRTSRLHDRLKYTLVEGEKWKIERLAP